MRRLWLAVPIALGLTAESAVTGAAPPAPAPGSFEELARQAVAVGDLATLVAPFVDDCGEAEGDVERARCQGTRSFLRARLPGRTFLATRDGYEALSVSPYDPALRGYRIAVAGCLACEAPVAVGPEAERLFVTLGKPIAGGAGALAGAVELARTAVTFGTFAEATAWARSTRPALRVELVFQPVDAPWHVDGLRGYAFKPLGVRVSDRCTGNVILSQPPSRGRARASAADCAPLDKEAAAEPLTRDGIAPAAVLGTTEINEGISTIRGNIDSCTRLFPFAGTTTLGFVVAGSGVPQSVTVEGSGAGMRLGRCLVDAGTRARFPAFRGEKYQFKYPVVVRK